MENHLKKRKKPEKKLAQDFPGYVGYKDVAYLTEYVTGSDSKSAIENMRNATVNSGGSSKEMNIKKKDKKAELNGLKDKKKNGREISSSAASNGSATSGVPERTEPSTSVNPPGDSTNPVSNDLTNDKNNNLTTAASSTEIIPTSSSTNHSSASSDSTVRKESIELSSGKPATKETLHSESNNLNSQPAKSNKLVGDKPEKSKAASSSNQSRKSSAANSEISNNSERQQSSGNSANSSQSQRSAAKDEKPAKSGSAAITSIVSNGLHGLDPMYIVSDSELPDQEGDFKIVKYKQLRRKKQKKGSNQEEHIKLTGNSNELSSGGQSGRQAKRDRQHSSAAQNPATARGYESESDYCAVEGRKKGLQRNEMKREVLLDNSGGSSSNCVGATGPKSSFSNSDSDSIHSSNEETATNRPNSQLINSDPTPFESASHFAPSTLSSNNVPYSKISYAAITKMHYSNPTSNGATSMASNLTSSNLTGNTNPTTVQPAQETRREFTNDKKNSTNDKNKATQKSITNPAEAPKGDEQFAKSNSGKDRKTPDDRKPSLDRQSLDRQPPKRLTKADSSEADRTDKAIAAEFEFSITDHSRTDSIDLNNPSFISSKSNSINSTQQQPPVIMLDNSKSSDLDSSFTFGFFNENAQFQATDEEPSKQFSSVPDVNMVNFMNKESATRQLAKSEPSEVAKTEKNDEEPRTDEPTGKPSKNEVPVSIDLMEIMNSPVANQPTPSGFAHNTTLNSNTPICTGTYIMESSEDYSAHDNITKKVVHDAKNDQRRSSHTNDLVSGQFVFRQWSPY